MPMRDQHQASCIRHRGQQLHSSCRQHPDPSCRSALYDELLHLLYCKVNGDNLGDAEECRLKDGVGAVAKTDFLSNAGCIDVVNGDVVLGK